MTLAEAAELYASWGWPVLPCHWIEDGLCSCGDPGCRSPGKHPYSVLVPRGLHNASAEPLVVAEWWKRAPKCNPAIRTGNGLAVIDVDNKPGVDGEDTLREWERAHGKLPDTIEALTGGGGRHLYLTTPPGVQLASGTNVLGPGVDVRAEGGYVLAPTSLHISGRRYEWEAANDPTDDSIRPTLAEMPPALLAALQAKAPKPDPRDTAAPTARLAPHQVAEIRAALAYIPADDRDTWVQVGMALESTRAGEQAYGLWTEWSQQSEKFDARDQRRVWRSFRPDHGVTLSTLYWRAQGAGFVSVGAPAAPGEVAVVEEDEYEPQEHRPTLPPGHLLTIPGVLGEFVAWSNHTAYRRQEQFSVQAALALGSVAMGRGWKTDRKNWPSLYLLNVGPSGCGKEHAKACIDRVLLKAGALELINGSGYTSRGAVYSSLRDRPAHLTVVDEFGMFLESIKARGNHHRADVVGDLMEAFGRCDGFMKPQSYSTMGLPQEKREQLKNEAIYNPAITLLGMTTPRTFYGALTSDSVRNGFLNRLLIVESATGRVPAQDVPDLEPPGAVLEWVERVRRPMGNLPVSAISTLTATPRVVPMSAEAVAMSAQLDRDVTAWQCEVERDGLDDLLTRVREIAMRVALIVAVSCDPEQPVVRAEHFGWAREYVCHCAEQSLRAVRANVADSKFEATKQALLRGLVERGSAGVTNRDLNRLAPFRAIPTRERSEALEALAAAGLARYEQIGGVGGVGGRPSLRWVAC